MPRSPYRRSSSHQKGKRDYRQVQKSSHDRYYGGQSRKKVHRSNDYPDRPRDEEKDRRREPFDDRHKKHQPYQDRPVIRIEPKSVVQIKRSEPESEIKVHFRFRPLTIKLNSVGEEDLKQKLKRHISEKIGPVAYFQLSADSQPGYLILQLGFRYDCDAFAYLDGNISQVDITIEKEKVWIEAEPTKTFRLLMNEVQQKKKKPSKHGERQKSRSHSKRSHSKRSKKDKSKHKRKKSYSETSSESQRESVRSRKSRSNSRKHKKKDDRDKKEYYENDRKDNRHDDRRNQHKHDRKEQRREDRRNDYKDEMKEERKEQRKDQRKQYRREESRREESQRQEPRREELRQQIKRQQYRKEQNKQIRRQQHSKQTLKQQQKPRIEQRIKEIPSQYHQKQQQSSSNINFSGSKIPLPSNQLSVQTKQQKTLYFFGIHYSVNSKDMDNLFKRHEEGPFIHQDLIWRQIKDSISVFLQGRFLKQHAMKLLQIGDKMEVRGHPFVIVESQSLEVDKLLEKIAQYQVNIQFLEKIAPYHLLKGLKQCGRVVQIISNNKLTDQGHSQYYNVTFNSKAVCEQLKKLMITSKQIVIEEVTKENALYIYRPNSDTELMTVNYVEEKANYMQERDFYHMKEGHRDYHRDYHRQGQRDYHKDRDYYKDKNEYYTDKGDYYRDYKDQSSNRHYERRY